MSGGLLSKLSGSDERTLRRVVKRVAEGTRTTGKAIVAEPSLNSKMPMGASPSPAKAHRHAVRLREGFLAATAAKATAGYAAAAQKAAAAATAAAAAAQKPAKAEPVSYLKWGCAFDTALSDLLRCTTERSGRAIHRLGALGEWGWRDTPGHGSYLCLALRGKPPKGQEHNA